MSKKRWLKTALLATGAVVLIGGTAGVTGLLQRPSSGPDEVAPSQPDAPVPAAPDPVEVARQALLRCDELTSHPGDANRYAAGVPDVSLAPGAAIEACETALQLNPELARAQFELARAYWAARRDTEAFTLFVAAADQGYAPAMKYIGDAYYENRGLPLGETKNANTALNWYRQAEQGGFADASEMVVKTSEYIERNTFRREHFQNGFLMEKLYRQDFQNVPIPLEMAYYVKGLTRKLGSQEILFIDSECAPLISKVGNIVVDIARIAAYLNGLKSSRDAAGVAAAWLTRGISEDRGERDAVALINRYGCDSEVTEQILSGIMITSRG